MKRRVTSGAILMLIAMLAAAIVPAFAASAEAPERPQARSAIAMHGEPALPENFAHFRYADPDAPKGGRLTIGVLGTFDSLNPLIVKGVPAQSLRGYVIESLLARGYDEPFTLYGLLARSVETDAERSFVTFNLDERARFSDGAPVTPEDVVFSWKLLRDKGRPNFRTYYAKVSKAEQVGERSVRFDLSGAEDRELPLILGLMPVLPRHAVDADKFEDTSLKPIIGSGPYVISAADVGKSVTLTRNPDYWGRDLPVNRGFWNFDTVRFEYYRDANSYFEAFRKGLFDLHAETDPGRWETAYDFPAARDGRVIKEEFLTGLPQGMLAFVFNTRRPVFADIRVREAVSQLLDFEWINRSLFFGRYQRSGSYFEGSELASRGRPADARERALLAPFPGAVRADVLEGTWSPPSSDGSGRDRDRLKAAPETVRRGGLRSRRHRAQGARDRQALHVRDHGDDEGSGAHRARLCAQPPPRRHRAVDPRGGRRAIRAAAHRFRLRHGAISLGPVALAGQRAGVLLGVGFGRRAGQPQLYGRALAGDRRDDRRHAEGAVAPGLRRRRARARPHPHLRPIRAAALSPARPVGGALAIDPPSAGDLAVRIPAGDLVAGAFPQN